MKMNILSPYSEKLYNNPKQYTVLVKRVAANVCRIRKKYHFDAITFTGMSGAGMAYPVSMLTGIPIICVRKNGGEDSHGHEIEGPRKINLTKFAIIDDFISSGNTVNRIIDRVEHTAADRQYCNYPKVYPLPKCSVIMLYDSCSGAGRIFNRDPYYTENFGRPKKRNIAEGAIEYRIPIVSVRDKVKKKVSKK